MPGLVGRVTPCAPFGATIANLRRARSGAPYQPALIEFGLSVQTDAWRRFIK
ncbi:MAG: hypothetical protein HY298_06010 [Verrucomicrobia bacterium]|nr:hypothetical protein [Verrucomicrobiota bacterium]